MLGTLGRGYLLRYCNRRAARGPWNQFTTHSQADTAAPGHGQAWEPWPFCTDPRSRNCRQIQSRLARKNHRLPPGGVVYLPDNSAKGGWIALEPAGISRLDQHRMRPYNILNVVRQTAEY